jgi:hypothetical protein
MAIPAGVEGTIRLGDVFGKAFSVTCVVNLSIY